MYNRAQLIGRLGKDPEISYTQSGTARCKFSLATTEVSFDKTKNEKREETEWHNIVVWGNQAENCSKYLTKGKLVHIEGRITTRSWDDKSGGQKRYITEINAQRVIFLSTVGGQQSGTGNEQHEDSGGPRHNQDNEQRHNSGGQHRGGASQGQSSDDDDIPF